MKTNTITKYMDRNLNEHYLYIDSFLDEDYESTLKRFNEIIKCLNKDIFIELDSIVSGIEVMSKDAAFDAGFAEGIKFAIHNKLQAN